MEINLEVSETEVADSQNTMAYAEYKPPTQHNHSFGTMNSKSNTVKQLHKVINLMMPT
jgi:hypothetical protein